MLRPRAACWPGWADAADLTSATCGRTASEPGAICMQPSMSVSRVPDRFVPACDFEFWSQPHTSFAGRY